MIGRESCMSKSNLKIKHFEELGSTNDYALKTIELGEITSDMAIIADKQTNGRGRLNGRIWISPIGNFYCSYIIYLHDLYIAEHQTNSLTFDVMEILHKYLVNITGSDKVTLKQPNDILVNNKKLAGVLTEISYPYAIIGIGINLTESPLASATNLKSEFNLLAKPGSLVENLYIFLINELKKCFVR